MKYPKGAIRTEEELRQAKRDKIPLYLVEWDDSDRPLRVKITKFGREGGGKYRVHFKDEWGRTEDYWLFKEEAAVPEIDEKLWCFFFTNFWHAYAYWLKSRAKS